VHSLGAEPTAILQTLRAATVIGTIFRWQHGSILLHRSANGRRLASEQEQQNNCSGQVANLEIHKPKVHYRVHKISPLDFIVGHTTKDNISTTRRENISC